MLNQVTIEIDYHNVAGSVSPPKLGYVVLQYPTNAGYKYCEEIHYPEDCKEVLIDVVERLRDQTKYELNVDDYTKPALGKKIIGALEKIILLRNRLTSEQERSEGIANILGQTV